MTLYPSAYRDLPPSETGINIMARKTVDAWLAAVHSGPITLTMAEDSLTLSAPASDARKRNGPKPSGRLDTFEARRNRTNAGARRRFEAALREAVRDHHAVVTLPNGDNGIAAHVDTVRMAMRAHRIDAGLSGDKKASETDFQRGRNAAINAGAVEIIGETYMRTAWAPCHTGEETH